MSLEIRSVRASCGCTSAAIADRKIAPESETTLKITINPKKIYGFESKKSVTITSNDPENPRIKIDVLAKIDPEFEIVPNDINFGEVEKGTHAEANMIVRQLGEEPIDVLDAKEWGANEQLALSVSLLPEDKWAQPGHKEYVVNVVLSPDISPGSFQGRFKIHTSCKRMPYAACTAKATVKAFYQITPKSIVLHNRNRGIKEHGAQMTLFGDRPFEVKNLGASDPAILLASRPGPKPNSVVIDMDLAEDAKPGSRNEKISFQVAADGKVYEERVNIRTLVRSPVPDGAKMPDKTKQLLRSGARGVERPPVPGTEKTTP